MRLYQLVAFDGALWVGSARFSGVLAFKTCLWARKPDSLREQGLRTIRRCCFCSRHWSACSHASRLSARCHGPDPVIGAHLVWFDNNPLPALRPPSFAGDTGLPALRSHRHRGRIAGDRHEAREAHRTGPFAMRGGRGPIGALLDAALSAAIACWSASSHIRIRSELPS